MKSEKIDFGMNEWRNRLRFMADIMFATSMSIMILNLEIPEIEQFTETKALVKFMLRQLSGMATFFIAFMTVSVYWMKHLEHFGITLKVSQTYVLYQLLFLAMILLIPFWSTYVSHAPDNVAIKVFLSLNMILIGVFSFISFNYAASNDHRLIDEKTTNEQIKTVKLQILTEPAIAAIAAGLAFIDPVYWDIAFILIPVLFAIRKKMVNFKYFGSLKNKSN
jgi:TMEM175 potassium channel family protein